MKKLLSTILLVASALSLSSCAPASNVSQGEFKLRGVVESVEGGYIEIRITEAQYATGTYRVLIGETTKICDKNGESITADSIEPDSSVEVTYNGQVMRSLPPQISAIKITVG